MILWWSPSFPWSTQIRLTPNVLLRTRKGRSTLNSLFVTTNLRWSVVFFCLIFTLITTSSVARGAIASPFGLKSMQNTPFLAFLSPIYALKAKIATPPLVLVMRIGQEPGVISTKKTGFQPGWRPFSFFLETTKIWTEKSTQSEWRPIKIWVKIVWCCFQPPKQLPPTANDERKLQKTSWSSRGADSQLSSFKNYADHVELENDLKIKIIKN